MPTAETSRELVVTLVHGTWGRGFFPGPSSRPRWFEASSSFYDKLTGTLAESGARYEIKPFLWSGANSVFEREQTAAELANKLATQREASRDAQQIVIAHSHGGNIALKALQYLEARGAADTPMDVPIGVATLATPFLQIYRVPENSSRSEAYFNIAFVFGCLLWIFVVAWFQFGNGFLAYGVGTGMLGVSFLAIHLLLRPWPLDSAATDKAYRLEAAAKYAVNGQQARVLVVRGIDDDASFALAIGSLVARLNHLMLNLFGSAGRVLVGASGILATCATAFLEAPPSGGFSLLALAGYALFLIMVVMLAALILIPLARSVLSRELMLGASRCDVAVNSSPDARAGVEVVTLPPTAASEGIMRHAIYQHDQCAPVVAAWALGLARS